MDSQLIFSIPGFSDPFSSMSHLLAAFIMLLLGGFTIWRSRASRSHLICYSIFTFCAVFLLSMSGVFHLLEPNSTGRDVLQRLDHAGIFLLIAGTFTPIHGILFKSWWRWGMLLPIWAIAITGLTLKTIFFIGFPEWFGLFLYLGLGWLGFISAIAVKRHYGFQVIKPLLYGAVAYSSGAVMEFLRMPIIIPGVIGPHELFHIAVLVGLGFHFYFVYQFAHKK
ncbi:COG1272: Predicted membrane protein hemolysin III homolog [hydrothermal vent metagenome]|uniref:COG1272: Predicted membrane protein hemolysin III homolog n=1 Tax=hydrothermal vent metagenome TaxID=652676 RepID=A0A3B0ZCJ8_9ZZZZ